MSIKYLKGSRSYHDFHYKILFWNTFHQEMVYLALNLKREAIFSKG